MLNLRLADILSTNTTIKVLTLNRTDFIGADDMEMWGDALKKNNTLTVLYLKGVGDEIVNHIKTKTKDRTPKLKVTI